ncbi:hypothetical protein PBI_SCTP2_169 [Salicola phage SCTP-2]|nr:hypothetical protein PBI_SCTP2_169 [Salicola phage SCTP-2]
MSNYQPGEQYKTVDYEADIDEKEMHQRLVINRLRMMQREPFYGTIALNLRLKAVDCEDQTVRSIMVDGRTLYYNPWFINALDDDEIVFAIAHEVMHCALRHLTRKGKKDNDDYWKSADYVINHILVRDGVGRFPGVGGLYDENLADKSTEEIYDLLHEQKQNQSQGGQDQGDDGQSNFDDHFDVQQSQDGSNGQDGDTIIMTESEMAKLDNEMQSAMMQASEIASGSKSAGSVPAEIQRMIKEITEPVMNWRDFIRENAKSKVKTDYSWKRPNKRFLSAGIIIPGIVVDDHYEFTVAVDASGSMSNDQLTDFLSEIYFIGNCFTSFKIGIFTFDTKVYGYKEFDQDNIDELLEYAPQGGGGTDFMACWEFMKNNDICPDTFVMLTDGMPNGSWGDPEYCDTIFLIHDEHAISQKVEAPFGTTLYYNDYVNE